MYCAARQCSCHSQYKLSVWPFRVLLHRVQSERRPRYSRQRFSVMRSDEHPSVANLVHGKRESWQTVCSGHSSGHGGELDQKGGSQSL